MKRLFLQIFAWLAILLGVGLMLQPTVSRYLTEQKSTKPCKNLCRPPKLPPPPPPKPPPPNPRAPTPNCTTRFWPYNQQLFAQGQAA